MPEISLPTKAIQDTIKLQTDKITDIKTKTDLIGVPNPTTADSSNVMNFLKKVYDKPTPPGGTNFKDFSILSQQWSGYGRSNLNYGESLTLFSISGGGLIAGLMIAGGNQFTEFVVTIYYRRCETYTRVYS
ncbi:hypothetical protein ACIQZM_18025 [Peribacillus sp. NPDC097206]|uniref:hypothetical protein n=1 Tax=unclassified Peribacillus TaxID=2675266 RepID=UPI00381596F6